MLLKQKLIQNIDQLSTNDLIVVQNFVQTLIKQTKIQKSGYLKTREALANCQGNLSEDVIQERQERL